MKAKKFHNGKNNADENSDQNDDLKMNFIDDYRYFSRSSVGIIQDKYCKCGRVRSTYDEKLTNYGMKTNDFYGMDKLTNKVFEMDKNAIFLTKKSIMLNQFLDDGSVRCNETAPNRLGLNNKRWERSAFDALQYQEKGSRTVCLPLLVFSDKRLVNLFRSVALYWFFCLNTVLAKGDFYKKKNLSVFDFEKSDPISTISSQVEIKIFPEVFQNFNSFNEDYFMKIFFDRSKSSSLLEYRLYSRESFLQCLMSVASNSVSAMIEKSGSGSRKSSNYRRSLFSSRKKFQPQASDYGYEGEFANKNVWRKRFTKNKFRRVRKISPHNRNTTVHFNHEEYFIYDDEVYEIMIDKAEEDENFSMVTSSDNENFNMVTSSDDPNSVWHNGSVAEHHELNERENEGPTFFNSGQAVIGNSESSSIYSANFQEYDMWNTISFAEDALPRRKPVEQLNGRIAPPPLELKDNLKPQIYKSYSLWESSSRVDEDFFPNFDIKESFSVYSLPHLAYPKHQQCTGTNANANNSSYSIWQAPDIIDDWRDQMYQMVNEQRASRSNERNLNSSSQVLGQHGNSSYYEPSWFGIFGPRERRQLGNFQPTANKTITFGGTGAFKPYRKSEQKSFWRTLKINGGSINNNTNLEITKVVRVEQFIEKNSPYVFKPIEIDIEARTDPPARIDCKKSGEMFYNDRLLMIYKHEDDTARSNVFQPKFTVKGVDQATQTDFVDFKPKDTGLRNSSRMRFRGNDQCSMESRNELARQTTSRGLLEHFVRPGNSLTQELLRRYDVQSNLHLGPELVSSQLNSGLFNYDVQPQPNLMSSVFTTQNYA